MTGSDEGRSRLSPELAAMLREMGITAEGDYVIFLDEMAEILARRPEDVRLKIVADLVRATRKTGLLLPPEDLGLRLQVLRLEDLG